MSRTLAGLTLALCAIVAGCGDDKTPLVGGGSTTPPAAVASLIGLTDDSRLVQFRANDTTQVISTVPLTGVQSDPGDFPFTIAMDIRPLNNEIYALFSDDRLYKVAPSTGALTLVGRPAFGAADVRALDFDPKADVIRAIAISGENFRVSPVDGSILGTDTTLAYVAGDPNNGQTPSVEGVAYT
ncbi:MAG TPA: DUF4394 domain-containing protein, partial [Solimonas sp.]|nr:DUF4394 domain-containing protein [Solimonas sp.]